MSGYGTRGRGLARRNEKTVAAYLWSVRRRILVLVFSLAAISATPPVFAVPQLSTRVQTIPTICNITYSLLIFVVQIYLSVASPCPNSHFLGQSAPAVTVHLLCFSIILHCSFSCLLCQSSAYIPCTLVNVHFQTCFHILVSPFFLRKFYATVLLFSF